MGRAATTPNFCSQCGSELDPEANYCGQCGTRCRPVSPADRPGSTSESRPPTPTPGPRADRGDAYSDGPLPDAERLSESTPLSGADGRSDQDSSPDPGPDHNLLAFRRRVQSRVFSGWEVERDDGDSVVLVDRDFGSAWVHLALFFVTGGVGNLLYGWYEYAYDADRAVLRADGHDITSHDSPEGLWPADVASAGLSVVGVLLLVMGVAILAGSPAGPASIVLGLTSLAGAAWAFPQVRDRFERRHPMTTFGRTRSVDERITHDETVPCVACGTSAAGGIERTYREEFAIVGLPLITTDTGTNVYCHDCANGVVPDDSSTGTIRENARGTIEEREPMTERH